MDSLRYAYITDRDMQQCERLRARGFMLPGMAFALKPRFQPDGSAEFKLSMLVPAALWVCLAISTLVTLIAVNRLGGIPPRHVTWFAGVICGLLVMAAWTCRAWRSVRVWPDGRARISEPTLFGRRVISADPGRARLLVGLSYARPDRVKRNYREIPSRLMLNPGRPVYHSRPCVLIAIESRTFTLAREDQAGIETLVQLLKEDYSFRLEPTPVLYRYAGLL